MPVQTEGNMTLEVFLADGQIRRHADALNIVVDSFKYDVGGKRNTFDGIAKQAVTDDDTNYVYLDNEGALQVNTTGYPTEVTYIPLGRVVCASGEIVTIISERIVLASSSAAIGTCRVGFPVDAGVRGGNSGVSSNNSIASITFDDVGESRNRWNIRPPQNYTSGDLTLRLYCSVAGTPGSKGVRWELRWGFISDTDSLPSSYPYSTAFTQDMSSISNDTLFKVDFTIPSSNFDNTEDMMYFYLLRDGDHGDDDCSLMVHIHIIELRYTGYKVAGQAGQ